MNGRQWSLKDIDLATDEFTKVKRAVAAQTGIDENEIVFENGYNPEGSGDQVRYDPEVYLPRCANGLTELRIVVDSKRGEILHMLKQVDRLRLSATKFPITFIDYNIPILVKKIHHHLVLNPYDIELLLATIKYTFCHGYVANEYNIEYVPMSIMDDLMVMRRIMNLKQGWRYMRYMGPNCKDDESLVMEAIKQGYFQSTLYQDTLYKDMLQHASPRLKNKESFLLEVVGIQKTGSVLQYASDRLKDDKSFVRALIQMDNDNHILCHASARVQQDKELLKLAISHDDGTFCAWSTCPLNIRLHDHDILRQVITNELSQTKRDVWVGSISAHFEPSDDNDTNNNDRKEAISKLPDDIIMSFLQYSTGGIFIHLSNAQRANKKFALAAVNSCSENLEFVDEKLKEDKDVVCAAIRECHSHSYGYARAPLQFVSETMCQHPDVQALVEQLSPRFKRRRTI